MGRVIEARDTRFSVVGSTLLQDNNLSLKAKGLAGLIFSLGENWEISIERLMEYSKDGRDSVRGAISELEEGGYLRRVRSRNGSGQLSDMDYLISDLPMSQDPTFDFATQENPTDNKITHNKITPYKRTSIELSTSLHSVDSKNDGKGNQPQKITREFISDCLDAEQIEPSTETIDAIMDWKESRTKLRKPLTARAVRLNIKRAKELLAEDPSHSIAEIFNQSTANGWSGVFHIQGDFKKSKGLTQDDYNKARLWGKFVDHQEGYTFTSEKGEL